MLAERTKFDPLRSKNRKTREANEVRRTRPRAKRAGDEAIEDRSSFREECFREGTS
jgi:hypothetical protein